MAMQKLLIIFILISKVKFRLSQQAISTAIPCGIGHKCSVAGVIRYTSLNCALYLLVRFFSKSQRSIQQPKEIFQPTKCNYIFKHSYMTHSKMDLANFSKSSLRKSFKQNACSKKMTRFLINLHNYFIIPPYYQFTVTTHR